ncbi:MAG: substrate-binding domain-containing protein, partial [Bifidobacteriaceae bacterium]|nr:substrate-binding domain-containing protein [Bifidobacteriaceae bacterium]
FRDRMCSAGLSTDLIEYGDYSQESGKDAALRLMRRKPDIDSIFVSSDPMATGAIQALKGLGLRVPADVQVIGFDDQPIAQLSDPKLTTIRQPFSEIGSHMVSQLVGLINGENPAGTTLPLELVVRDSTR